MSTRPSGSRGFTLIEIMIVVSLIGLLMAIAIPSFVRARKNAQTNTCINNLRVIDAVKQQWALEDKKAGSDSPTPSQVLSYITRGGAQTPVCPAAGGGGDFEDSYQINPVHTAPECLKVPSDHIMPI